MPRTTGVDILNIKPDAEMGLAQDTSIPVPAVALDQTNKANQDIRLYDHQRQLMKYDHELKQQAKLLEGIANDEVAVGAIEPEDQAEFDRIEREVDKLFLDVKSEEPGKDLQNKALKAYNSKLQDLKDYAAAAQAKHVQLNKLRQTGAAIDPDDDAKAGFDDFFNKQKSKYPGQIIDPYVPPVYADFEALKEYQKGALLEGGKPINVPATTTTNKVTVGPKGKTEQTTTTEKPIAGGKARQPVTGTVENGLLPVEYTEPDKEWSFDEIYRKANFDAATPKGMKNQRRIWETFMGNPDLLPKKQLEEWNKQLAKYHTQKGIESIKTPGTSVIVKDPITGEQSVEPGAEVDTGEFPYQINYQIDKDGKIIMRDDPVALAAKISLANVDGDYVVKGKKGFSEEAFKLNMLKSKNDSDIMLNGVKAQGEKAKAGWYWAKIADLKDDDKKEKLISDGWVSNLTTQKRLAEVKSDGTLALAQIPNTETTPMFGWADEGGTKPVIIKPIGSEVIYGTDPANLATFGKPVGYKGGYYDQIYTRDGFSLTEQDLKKAYDNFVADYNSDAKKSKQDEWTGTIDDFLKDAIKRKKVDVKIKGERGATTKLFHTQAFKKALGSSKNYTDFIE